MIVWLNHWFSTAYYFIDSLKKDGYYVIATNKLNSCVYRKNADEFYVEPSIDDEKEYLLYCLGFCKSHNVDVFVPRKGMNIISRNLDKFSEINVKVLCESNTDWLDILDSKIKTASYFSKLKVCNVPLQIPVKNLDEFKVAYKRVLDLYGDVCIKYDCDEGGQSYKHITDRTPNMKRILENNGLCYDYDYICKCLGTVKEFNTIVVMPYLNGEEISVDCLGVAEGFIAIPRRKLTGRITYFEQSDELYNICKTFWESMPLKCPFNIQFRYDNNKLYLLEVNTRFSGGSWKTQCLGVDFVSLAIKNLLGRHIDLPDVHFSSKAISNLEGYVEL